ncbi:hypothetical protein BGZ63DRAFT_348212 [Mariannaea sp. PMI_226]|nr:hypothetical protein BGZ63DRAFT_348212 [Mariannaea sp. PMI_226]
MPSAPNSGMGQQSRFSTPLSNSNSNTNSSSTVNNHTATSSSSPTDTIDATSSPALSTSSPPQPQPQPQPPSSSSSRPGFLSRLSRPLSLPLRSRNRNVTDFHIRSDEPHRRCVAGDHVRGAVVLVVVKPIRFTHLVVSLHGYVRVLKDPAAVAKTKGATVLPQGGGSMRPRYHGNGLASLFQDEQVLSGEGRLDAGKYEFGFDLVFPQKGLPSSIEFERGTISYNITATLTRPTSIAPTLSCDRKVMLAENVDIGLLQAPRPRTIFLEPISKRTRRKKSSMIEKATEEVAEATPEQTDSTSQIDSSPSEEARDPGSGTYARSPIQSDVRSEISGESASTNISRNDVASLAHMGALPSSASAKQQAVDKKTITATIELLRGGCLPGDAVTVRISVQHIKRVKSMTGVIVTLYRQGKIDSAPPEALFNEDLTEEERRLAEKGDVYPRSRTGLGGLSLSSSSSTSIFRKDLDQNTAPLIIDPTTLQTTVTMSVKLPDDSFPTIKGVPGDMISFKYLVEVVVDLGGRLANQLQGGASSRFGSYSHGTGTESNTSSFYGPMRGNNIADTSQLRREKGVISVSLEILVGTTDSSRGRKRSRASLSPRRIQVQESDDDDHSRTEIGFDQEIPYEYRPNGQNFPTGYLPPHLNGTRQPPTILPPQPPYSLLTPSTPSHPLQMSPQSFQTGNGSSPAAAPAYFPPPQIPEQNELSEKEQIRQAETRLLPSAPPAAPEAGPSNSNNNDDIYDADDVPRTPRLDDIQSAATNAPDGPSAPTEEDLTATAPPDGAFEDKQELERRRMMNEASAPPDFPIDEDQRDSGPSTSRDATYEAPSAPSAPMLDDLDDFPGLGPRPAPPRTGDGREDVEELPAYRR